MQVFQPTTPPLLSLSLLIATRFFPLDNIDYKSTYLALKANNEMTNLKKRKRGAGEKVQSVQGMGRPIRMLAALFGEVPLIITDAESYLVRGHYPEDDDIDEFTEDLTPKQEEYLADKRECERNLLAYEQIARLVPALKQKLLEDAEELLPFYAALQKGANDSRSDDFSRVTQALATWLNVDKDRAEIRILDHTPDRPREAPAKPFLFADRANRGVDHDVCGGLLSCIEHDWADEHVRDALRDNTKPLNESFYCRIFYKLFLGAPDDVTDGFLQSRKMDLR
ncbi:hypothetical protein K438DRAFT_2021998 [Mycena galopus ATCC 62051]|nr:hypothetical protein K438DRAFT_2021998 [Mycena galopus ATCC 62051]